jgi:hypothetical protein
LTVQAGAQIVPKTPALEVDKIIKGTGVEAWIKQLRRQDLERKGALWVFDFKERLDKQGDYSRIS